MRARFNVVRGCRRECVCSKMCNFVNEKEKKRSKNFNKFDNLSCKLLIIFYDCLMSTLLETHFGYKIIEN